MFKNKELNPTGRILFVGALIGMFFLGPAPQAEAMAPQGSPSAVVEQVVTLVREMQNNPATGAQSKKVSSLLNVEEVSKRTLGTTWDKLTQPERKRFVGIFTGLLEKVAYPKSSKFFSDLEINVDQEKVQQENATVRTSIQHPEEGRIGIDYRLRKVSGRWLITDIVLDGVSLVADLTSQMQQILSENSYDELTRRMQEKIQENSN
ncbi:MAG: ABC transporter substrate-binding protein [Deltaproteobacteria bacterium]|nr:ABC transporter substrate-binding protein [Deltaproteobacteria bacterium]